jgi:hypothetical protein
MGQYCAEIAYNRDACILGPLAVFRDHRRIRPANTIWFLAGG